METLQHSQIIGGNGQNYTTQDGLKWRILFADSGKLTLISDTTANTGFNLAGANGYNNGVLLLNETCKALYSNTSLGAEGRSIDIDDLEKVSKYDKTNYSNSHGSYGNEYTATDKDYPSIFQYEKTGAVNGIYGTEYDLSDQTSYTTGDKTASSIKGKWTYYTYTLMTTFMDPMYLELFRYQPGTTTDLTESYWLASRSVRYAAYSGIGYLYFHISFIESGIINGNFLYGTGGGGGSGNRALRPVVEIDLFQVIIGETGTGTRTSPYSIVAK